MGPKHYPGYIEKPVTFNDIVSREKENEETRKNVGKLIITDLNKETELSNSVLYEIYLSFSARNYFLPDIGHDSYKKAYRWSDDKKGKVKLESAHEEYYHGLKYMKTKRSVYRKDSDKWVLVQGEHEKEYKKGMPEFNAFEKILKACKM